MDSKTLKLFGQNLRISSVLLVIAGVVGSVAEAVEPTVYQLGDGGAIAPHLRVELGSDNNPMRADAGSEESLFLRLQPSVTYLVQRRNNSLSFGYSGDYYQYFQEYCQNQGQDANGDFILNRPGDCLNGSPTFDQASYQDHSLSLNGFLEVSKRLRALLQINQSIEHQPLGTGLSANRGVLGALTSPDYWNSTTARAQMSYGAYQARGEVRVGVFLRDDELNSGRNVNLDLQSDNSVSPYAQLLYRVGTRTQLFAGIGLSEVRDGISFNSDGSVIENNERDISRISFGAEIDPKAVTSGSISISQVDENFLANRDDLTYLGLDVNLIWRPRRFSTVTISAGRETENGGFNANDLSLTTNFGVEWIHFWRDRLSTRVDLTRDIGENVNDSSEFFGSKDTTTGLRVEGNYNIRRWLDIGGFVGIDTRAGSEEDQDFERTVIGFTANGTI